MNKSNMLLRREAVVKKIRDYLKENLEMDKRINGKVFLAGGAILSWIKSERPNDYDFYFNDREYADNFVLDLQNHMCNLPDELEHDIIINDSAITFKSLNVQLVVRFAGKPDDVINRFDFAHTQSYATADRVVIKPQVYESIAINRLLYTGSEYPVSALFRLRKFLARGWEINAGEIVKIAVECGEHNLMDRNVLAQQLIGVDLQYFDEAIERLFERGELNVDTIFEVMDEVFR